MAGPIDNAFQTIAAFNVTSPVGAEVAEATQGNYRGEVVSVSTEASKIADAAEELGMSVAHRAEKRSLGEREVKTGRAIDPDAVARLQSYLDKLPDMPREAALQALVEQLEGMQDLLEGGGGAAQGATKDDVLAALAAFDGDVTHQFAALETARTHFEATGADPAFLALLDAAQTEFERTDLARDVRAGFAAAEVATRAAQTLETDPATVRDVYRAMLRETMHAGKLFDALAAFDLRRSFAATVETFRTAAGRDLASAGPSTDPAFLHGLLMELGKLKKMQTVFEGVRQLVGLTERGMAQVGTARGGADAVDQTSRVLHFAAQATAAPADARRMLGAFAERSAAAQVVFANGLRGLHGEIPDDVMPNAQARLHQAKALMGLLDELAAEDEETYATDEDIQREARGERIGGSAKHNSRQDQGQDR